MITLIEGQNCRRSRQIKLMGIVNLSGEREYCCSADEGHPILAIPSARNINFHLHPSYLNTNLCKPYPKQNA
jgi:hypothetical protein